MLHVERNYQTGPGAAGAAAGAAAAPASILASTCVAAKITAVKVTAPATRDILAIAFKMYHLLQTHLAQSHLAFSKYHSGTLKNMKSWTKFQILQKRPNSLKAYECIHMY